jgi:3-oxoacyl-[acyl-carrier protein] reductase
MANHLIVVSGAAKGIGKASVEVFAGHGWKVLAIDRDDAIRTIFASTQDVTPVVADVTDPVALAQLFEHFNSPARALVNAAGIFPPTSLSSLTVEQYRRIFDVNVLGTLLLSQMVGRNLLDGGSIINFASTNAYIPRPDQLIYAATKAAIVSVTRSMAADFAKRRIRVNAIAPGPVDTDGFRNIPGRYEEVVRQVPLGRVQTPEEVAELAFWLVDGEGAQFITGETVVCSGGLFMR